MRVADEVRVAFAGERDVPEMLRLHRVPHLGVERHREGAAEVQRQFRCVSQVRPDEAGHQRVAERVLLRHGRPAAGEVLPEVRVALGDLVRLDGAPLVHGRRHGPEVVVVVDQSAHVLVRMVVRHLPGPGVPALLGRRVVRPSHLGDHRSERRLDPVVVDQVPDLLVGGVPGDVAHVVRVARSRSLVRPQVLHAEVGRLGQSPAHRLAHVRFVVEEDHRRLAVRHRGGDAALVVAVDGARVISQQVLHHVQAVLDLVAGPAGRDQEVDPPAVRCRDVGVAVEVRVEHLRHVGGKVDDAVGRAGGVDFGEGDEFLRGAGEQEEAGDGERRRRMREHRIVVAASRRVLPAACGGSQRGRRRTQWRAPEAGEGAGAPSSGNARSLQRPGLAHLLLPF